MSEPLHLHFEDVEVGQVLQLGAVAVDEAALDIFAERFAPGWDVAYGAPDAMIYALWSRLAVEKAAGWAQSKVLAVDGLRYMRNPPPHAASSAEPTTSKAALRIRVTFIKPLRDPDAPAGEG